MLLNFNKPLYEAKKASDSYIAHPLEDNGKYSNEELRQMIEDLDWADKSEKMDIIKKLGLNSETFKKDYLINQILQLLQIRRKKKDSWDKEDFKDWDKQYNYPLTKKAILAAAQDETPAFVQFLYDFYKQKYASRNKAYDYSYSGKALAKRLQSFYEVANIVKLGGLDGTKDKLVNLIIEETEWFRDLYVNDILIWEGSRFDTFELMKDFTMEDFMSFFGVMNESDKQKVIDIMQERGWGVTANERSWYYRYCGTPAKEWTSDKKLNGMTPKPILVTSKDDRYSSCMPFDLKPKKTTENTGDMPGKIAVKYAHEVEEVKKISENFVKQEYLDYWKEKTEKDYEKKIKQLCEVIRNQGMNEDNIMVDYIDEDVVDVNMTALLRSRTWYFPNANDQVNTHKFVIQVSDGNKTIYARSIFAAAQSVLVRPHFRFICTTKENNHIELD